MATDLDEKASASVTKIVGADSSGEEGYYVKVNPDGSIFVTSPSVVSTVNSSSTPLGISGVFTGTGEDVKDMATITVFVRADQASASGGLSVQWSTDNTNWDDTDTFTIAANTGKSFTFFPQTRYFRIVYTNGAVAQTAFRLQSILHYFQTKPSSHRIDDTISGDNDAELSKSVLTGKDVNGNFQNVRVTQSGGILVENVSLITPPNTEQVKRIASSSVVLASPGDDFYTITNGKTLTIQNLQAGAQDGTDGSKVTLYEDASGTGSPLVFIGVLYVNQSSASLNLQDTFVGDGTRRILMRRYAFSAAPREISGRWVGYEV